MQIVKNLLFSFLADIITGSVESYVGHTLQPYLEKRSSEPVFVIQHMTVGISGEFPFSFLMMEIILVEIHYSLVKHWDGKCRILCVLVLMKFEAFSIFSNCNACAGFLPQNSTILFNIFRKYQDNHHNQYVTQCICILNVVPHVLRTVQCFRCYMQSPKI